MLLKNGKLDAALGHYTCRSWKWKIVPGSPVSVPYLQGLAVSYSHVAGALGGVRGSKSSIGDVKRDGIVNGLKSGSTGGSSGDSEVSNLTSRGVRSGVEFCDEPPEVVGGVILRDKLPSEQSETLRGVRGRCTFAASDHATTGVAPADPADVALFFARGVQQPRTAAEA